jgi:hypothetical protein
MRPGVDGEGLAVTPRITTALIATADRQRDQGAACVKARSRSRFIVLKDECAVDR